MSQTILIVDDNEDTRALFTDFLAFHGYVVLTASDGEEALLLIAERQPALVLMDLALPRLDGWEAARRLKADPATAALPVLALTAHALQDDRMRGEEIGFDAYITKPVEPADVLVHIRAALDARAGDPGRPC